MPALSQELDQIELTPLSENRVLMIVVTRDHMVRNRVVTLEEPATREELGSIRNYVNRHFSGWKLESARRELLRRMLEDRELYDAALRKLDALCRMGLLEGDAAAPEIYTDGASNLLEIDLHLTRERLRDLMRALEEKRRLMELLERFLEQPPGELAVHVGLGDIDPVMQDLSMVGMTVRLPGGQPAKVAVLGPMRMNYECVIAAIQRTSRALENAWY
jgi:heat-inducible transcriptional repressor